MNLESGISRKRNKNSPEALTPLGFLLWLFSLSISPCPFGTSEILKPIQCLDITGFLEMEASCLNGLFAVAMQND